MALNQLGLGFLFTAKDQASGTIKRLSGGFNKLQGDAAGSAQMQSKAMVGLGAATAVAGAGIAGLAVGFGAANAFGNFEQGVANVGATMQATEAELKKLSAAAIQAGIDTQFSPVEATKGLDSLAAAGQTADQAIKSLTGVLDLAAGSKGQLGLAESAEAVVGTLNSYGMSADQATAVTDKLLLATTKSNFQARDFSAGLSKAAASGAAFGQDLDTVLVTMGFLRNANLDASSSATAFREATRRLGSDQRAQQAVTKQGVDIFDEQTGKMRQLPEVMLDFAKATEKMSTEERQRAAAQAFGARGLLAFNAILKSSFTKTLPDGTKQVLKGKEALEAFREALKTSGGTAEKMREQLLDTFEGQKTLLKGTLETLAITGGEAFAEIFRPIVSAVTGFLNMVIKAIKATPKPIKKLIGGLFLGVSAFVAIAGGIGMAVAAFALLKPAIGAIVIGLKVAAVALIPIIAIIGAITLAVVGFRQAFDKNIGGIADRFGNTFGKIKLAFQAIVQFLSEGKISGAVAEELGKAENQGVFNFVNGIVQKIQAVINFFQGISRGFSAAIDEMGPTFERLGAAFDRLGNALGFLGDDPGADKAKQRFEDFGSAGERVGATLGAIFEGIVNAISFVVEVISDVVTAFRETDTEFAGFSESFSMMGDAVGVIAEAFGATSTAAGGASNNISVFKGVIMTLAAIFGVVVRHAALAFRVIAEIVAVVIAEVKAQFGFFMAGVDLLRAGFALLSGDTERAFAFVKRAIFRALAAIVGKIAFFANKVASLSKSLGIKVPGIDIQALASNLNQAKRKLEAGIDEQSEIISPKRLKVTPTAQIVAKAMPEAAATAAAAPAVAAAGGRAGATASEMAAAFQGAASRIRVRSPSVKVDVNVDGENIPSTSTVASDDAPGGGGTGS